MSPSAGMPGGGSGGAPVQDPSKIMNLLLKRVSLYLGIWNKVLSKFFDNKIIIITTLF